MPSASKISLGSLVYELDNLPSFYVVEIETLNSNDEQVLSRKLRCSAVSEFLAMKGFTFPHAVNYNAKKNQLNPSPFRDRDNIGLIDHLIIPCKLKGDLKSTVQQALDDKDSEITLLKNKETRRNAEGQLQDYDLCCRFKAGARIVSPHSGDDEEQVLYTHCLDTFICTGFHNGSGRISLTNPAKKSWLLRNESRIKSALKTKGLAQYCSAQTHVEPLLKLEKKELHLNLELALCLDQAVAIPDLLFEYLGNGVLGSVHADQLSLIKGILVGLEVKYLDPEKNPDRKTDRVKLAADLGPMTPQRAWGNLTIRKKTSTASFHRPALSPISNSSQPGTPVARKNDPNRSQASQLYRIQDIKSSAEVSRFIPQRATADDVDSISDANGQGPISVAAYFRTIKNAELKYPNLPLAKVRNDTWIPLEFLMISERQILRNTGHLTDFVKVAPNQLDELIKYHNVKFAKIDKEEPFHLIEQAQQRVVIFRQGSPKFTPPPTALNRATKKEPEADPKSALPPDMGSFRARLIYIPSPYAESRESDKFLQFVAHGLHQKTNREGSRMTFSKPLTTLIEVEKPLLLEPHLKGEGEGEDVIIGIIDPSGRTKAGVDQIRAEIHRYSEQKIGCIAICISKEDLEKSFHKNVPMKRSSFAEDNPYFPEGLLQKINFMLGGTNYKSTHELKPLEAISARIQTLDREEGKRVSKADSVASAIIFGAHLSHPGSKAGVSCPSVAAIVGTVSDTTLYLGSARLQSTVKQTTQRKAHGREKPGIKHIMQSRILGLQSMIKERLQAMKDSNEHISHSAVFFRHGLNGTSAPGVVQKEIADIKAAFEDFGILPEDVKLTYIVVTHNSQIIPLNKLATPSGFATEELNKPKYWYSIESDDLEIRASKLKDLVSKIKTASHQ